MVRRISDFKGGRVLCLDLNDNREQQSELKDWGSEFVMIWASYRKRPDEPIDAVLVRRAAEFKVSVDLVQFFIRGANKDQK